MLSGVQVVTAKGLVRRVRADPRVLLPPLRDAVVVGACLWLALLLRFGGAVPAHLFRNLLWIAPIGIGSFIILALSAGMYRGVPRYVSLGDMFRLTEVVTVTCAVVLAFSAIGRGGAHALPLSVALISAPLIFVVLAGVRLGQRVKAYVTPVADGAQAVLIIGAGDAGEMVVRDLLRQGMPFRPVGFLDDDRRKVRQRIHNVPVLGTLKDLERVVASRGIGHVLVAMPTAPAEVVRGVLERVAAAGLKAKIIPGIPEVLRGPVTAADIRDVDVADLIGRNPVAMNVRAVAEYIQGATVLVTGAAGSIGSELARQVLRFRPARLLALDNNETDLFYLDAELRGLDPEISVVPVLGDIRNVTKVDSVFSTYHPDVVFHAAAYKHVPMLEDEPAEAVLTNVVGTMNLVHAATAFGAKRFILVSTDKAVRPANVMGATKRIAEMLIAHAAAESGGIFAGVRFGNVLGSRGSVVPIFARQIREGKPITVTHAETTRYFMTIEEAASLIIQAGALASGGETFVLDMGDPVKIVDLAERMRALLAGPGTSEIVLTGLRPGEKIHEDLWHSGDDLLATSHARIFRIESHLGAFTGRDLFQKIAVLKGLADERPATTDLRRAVFQVCAGPLELELNRFTDP